MDSDFLADTQATLDSVPKNLICNFRAPDLEKYMRWKQYVQWAKDNGLDVCHLTLALVESFLNGVGEASEIRTGKQTITIYQQNVFQYQVKKPRREPYDLSCVKPEFRRTFSSLLFEAYVLQKASELNRPFCFRDFLELKHDAFRRIILRLKRKGKIIPFPQRTCPRFYILTSKLNGEQEQHSKTNVYREFW